MNNIEHDKFYFYSKSANSKPGKGSNESLVNPKDPSKYSKLENIKDWRKMLSNFYISPFVLDDETWNSVEHFFHAIKFRDSKRDGRNYDFYKTFAIDSGSPWSLEPVSAKQAGKAGRISKTTGKVYTKKFGDTKIPTDVSIRPDFYSVGIDRKLQTIAFLAKFTQNEELKNMLLATNDAELWHYVGRGAENQLWTNLMKVRDCIRIYDKLYNLSEVSKFPSDIVSRILE